MKVIINDKISYNCKQFKDPEILFNADWVVDNEITMDSLKGKAFITSATAEKCYDKVKMISENIEPLREEVEMASPKKCQNQESKVA